MSATTEGAARGGDLIRPAAILSPMEKLENRIAELLAEFEPGEYGPETEILVDLDIDSLDYASVVLTLEEETGISLEERDIDWSDVRSVADLAGLFESKQPTDA